MLHVCAVSYDLINLFTYNLFWYMFTLILIRQFAKKNVLCVIIVRKK